MVEMGARFAKDLYVKTAFDPAEGDCTVTVEVITEEGVVQTHTGEVTWDE